MVVDDRLLAVVDRGQVRLGDRQADAVAEPLAERAGRHLDPGRVVVLGMPGRPASELPERPQVVEGEVVARQVQQRVEQGRTVAGREHEPVAVEPVGVGRVEAQVARP